MPMNPRLLRPTASGFDPRRLAGIELWLNAADASSITTDTGVSVWADRSGKSGRNATQTTGGNQPAYNATGLNGRPSVQFTASGAKWMIGSLPLTMTAETVFVVASMGSASQLNARLYSQIVSGRNDDFSGTNNYAPCIRSGSAATLESFASGSRAGVAVSYDVPFVFSSTHSGSQIANRINNGAAATAAATLSTTFSNYLLTNFGNTSQGGYLTGFISEVVVYSRALADSERQQVIAYLGRKWGIAV